MTTTSDKTSSSSRRTFEPISETVSFTGPGGAVVRPVQGGSWTLSSSSGNEPLGKSKELTFDLTFPEPLTRRDVTIDAGSTLQCVTAVYTQTDLDYLNQEFYAARDEAWSIGGELNSMSARRDAPKRWNFETNRWEKRHDSETNPLTWMQTQAKYWRAKAKQEDKNRQRPDPNTLSAMGRLPGLDEFVYIQKSSGIVRNKAGAVMGTWQAEPIITDKRPLLSRYRNL
jgi:hypothetical protein